MSTQSVSAKVVGGDRAGEEFEVKVDLPDTLEEARERYGDDITYSHVTASLRIALQSFMRIQIKKDGATIETVQAAVDDWKPGTKQRGRTLAEKIEEMMGKLSDDERQELLNEFLS